MLEIKNVFLQTGARTRVKNLLSGVSASFPSPHFVAVIGPSGCGKTTLLKLIAGIAPGREEGEIRWKGRDLAEQDFQASEIAYVPQFSLAHEELTTRECVHFALSLRVSHTDPDQRSRLIDSLLEEVGLDEQGQQFVATLSGGQRRRLSLAMELASRPEILLCDEVTSGLDPQSEEDIVALLCAQSRHSGRLVLSVTHSLAHLEHYDSVLVLHEGFLAYHGPPDALAAYFDVEHPDHLYARLKEHSPAEWGDAWEQHLALAEENPRSAMPGDLGTALGGTNSNPSPATQQATRPPGPLAQFAHLLRRRFLIFSRSPSQIALQLGLILGFPMLVAVFAWQGLPEVANPAMGLSSDVSQQFTEKRDYLEHATEVGSLVSGIVMFQVILLTLIGANNSGREIAGERTIYEKERLAGLSPLAYVASKAAYLLCFVIVQSVWMGVFIRAFCQFPGDFLPQLAFLVLVNAAITAICLGISSLLATAEQASLASIYLVGFQLPLSGAVLALPDTLGTLVRPFISAYWSWSGILQTLQQGRYYDLVQSTAQSPIAPIPVACLVLLVHTIFGCCAAWIGCERRRLF